MNSNAKIQHFSDTYQRPIGGIYKRTFDIVFSLLAILALLPLMVIIGIIHRIADGGPIFFIHERVGCKGIPFGCIKLRTMVVDADKRLSEVLAADPEKRDEFERDSKLKDDPRIIPIVGKFIRSSSLDEIPQFFNVLRGDMSVVGPRPVVERELAMYGASGVDYLSAKPGITGLWQVSGRNETTFDERVDLDRTYVRSWTFWGDIRIIARTIIVVLRREGAY